MKKKRSVQDETGTGVKTSVKTSILDGLNERQKEVVKSVGGHQLVIASAGSGKTTVLARCAASLVEKGVSPDRILLLTFTKKAAREMKERAVQVLDERAEGIECGTFHSFALKLLREFGDKAGCGKEFSVLSPSDEVSLLEKLAKETNAFPVPAKNLQDIFSLHINTGESLKSIIDRKIPQYNKGKRKEVEKSFHDIMIYKKQNFMLTFDDMLLYCLKALEDETVRKEVAERFKYILVDEYQDTNHLQVQILKKLESVHHNLLGVGDDSQSIYKFRGADCGNILSFPKDFEGCSTVKLEENYRSTKAILDLANAVCESFTRKFDKEMFTSRKENGEKPRYLRVADEREQAEEVAREIQKRISEGCLAEDCAVLFRTGASGILVKNALDSLNIPSRRNSDLSLFEKAHVKDLMALMRVVFYPSDTVAWNRVLELVKGVGMAAQIKILTVVLDHGRGLDALRYLEEDLTLSQKEHLPGLFGVLKEAEKVKELPFNAMQLLKDWYLKEAIASKYSDWRERTEDLDTVLLKAGEYGFGEGRKFLEDAALDETAVEKGVVLSTMHGAKGLEFKNVWVINICGSKFPSPFFCKTKEDLEEERRIFYVAITRAKEHLTIVSPMSENEIRQMRKYGKVFNSEESRFMLENPDILQKCVTVEYGSKVPMKKTYVSKEH